MKIDDLASQISRQRSLAIERLIVEHVEAHLGRVPTNAEVSANGRRIVMVECPDEEHYYWNTQRLFSIRNAYLGSFEVF